MYFFDSSAWVKLFVAEKGSAAMISLAEDTKDSLKVVSALAVIEVRSAIRRRQRLGELRLIDAEAALQSLSEETQRVKEQPLTPSMLAEAAALIDRRAIRALDAIQLATAVVTRDTEPDFIDLIFVCSDARLLDAAVAEHFKVINPEGARPHP